MSQSLATDNREPARANRLVASLFGYHPFDRNGLFLTPVYLSGWRVFSHRSTLAIGIIVLKFRSFGATGMAQAG